jgi:Zn-dependent M28 family amino/carboxypeptidase
LGITDSLMRGGTYFNVVNATDQPTTLLLNFDSVKQIQVYGELRNTKEDRARTPKEFLAVYDRLIHYEDPAAKAWLPDSI